MPWSKLGGQGFFGLAHQVAALLHGLAQEEGVLGGRAGLVQQGGQRGGVLAQPALKARGLLVEAHVGLVEPRQPAAGERVVRVGGDEGAHVSEEGIGQAESSIHALEVAAGHRRQRHAVRAGRRRGSAGHVVVVQVSVQRVELLAELVHGGLKPGRLEAREDVGEVPAGEGH